MQKRKLGNTNIEVSALGLGTVKFGRNQGVKYPAHFELPSDQEIQSLLACAHELGINLLDTAPAYGSSEERIGRLLSNRHEWVLATKAGEEFIGGNSSFDFSMTGIARSVERSLQRLRTDYLDIVLIHSSGDDVNIIQEDGVFDTLARLKEQGKIRAYGMSTKTREGGLMAIAKSDVAMVTYYPGYLDEEDVIIEAEKLHKGILIKKAFASGHLGKIGEHDPINESLRFITRQKGVSSVVIGTLNQQHLRENVAAMANMA